jgi:hypothetical protein
VLKNIFLCMLLILTTQDGNQGPLWLRSALHSVSSDPVNSVVKCSGSMGCTTLSCASTVGHFLLVQLRVKIDGILDAELSVDQQLGRVGSPFYSCPQLTVHPVASRRTLFLDVSRRDRQLILFPRARNEVVLFLSDTFNTIAWIEQNFFLLEMEL